MSAKSMDVFSLRDAVVGEYKKFATSFTTIHAEDIRAAGRGDLRAGPLLARAAHPDQPELQAHDEHRRSRRRRRARAACGRDLPTPPGADARRSAHPLQAPGAGDRARLAGRELRRHDGHGLGQVALLLHPDRERRARGEAQAAARRTRAIIIYPMNALANSQLEELDKFVAQRPGRAARHLRALHRAGRQRGAPAHRREPARHPADQLHDARAPDDPAGRARPQGHRELRGAALPRARRAAHLPRPPGRRRRAARAPRARAPLAREAPVHRHVGDDGERGHRSRTRAGRRRGRLQALRDARSPRATSSSRRSSGSPTRRRRRIGASQRSAPAIDAGIRRTSPTPAPHASARHLGRDASRHHVLRRRPALGARAAAHGDGGGQRLAEDVGRDAGSVPHGAPRSAPRLERPRDGAHGAPDASERSFFAFKLHQFISGAGHAFATLEPPGARRSRSRGSSSSQATPDKRLYPVHFCRECGHEYHPVRLVTEDGERKFLARDIDDAAPPSEMTTRARSDDGRDDEREVFGFLTLHATRRGASRSRIARRTTRRPGSTSTRPGTRASSAHYRRRASARGRPWRRRARSASGTKPGSFPGKFRFCLRCGATHGGAARDRTRLASLSAEGRSSATTVLVGSALRWMHGEDSGLDRTSASCSASPTTGRTPRSRRGTSTTSSSSA